MKLLNKIKTLYEKIFKLHCPICGGIMDSEMYDMDIDHMVYKCRECEEEWI